MALVLVVDDDPVFGDLLQRTLISEGYSVQRAVSGHEAIAIAADREPDLLIADWLLQGDMGGLEVARILRDWYSNLRIMFVTGFPASELDSFIGALPVVSVYEKPVDLEVLVTAVAGQIPAQPPAQS